VQRDGGPGGAGGAGNPVGNTFTGTASGLDIYGDFCAAYSGQIIANNNTVTCLEFRTGNHLSVVEFSQGVNYSNVGNGKLIGFTIELNGTVICTNLEATQTFGTNENNEPSRYAFIIPPYTEVKTEATTDGAADIEFFHTITGRIYRG